MSHYQFNYLILLLIKKSVLKPGKHGRGTGGAAPASDAAGRGDAQGTPLPARPATWIPRGFHRRAPTRADSGRLGPESAGIGRYQPVSAEPAETADSGRNSKKVIIKNPERTEIQSSELSLIYENHVFSYYLLLLLNLVYVCIM